MASETEMANAFCGKAEVFIILTFPAILDTPATTVLAKAHAMAGIFLSFLATTAN
jgi:hypothetical protein